MFDELKTFKINAKTERLKTKNLRVMCLSKKNVRISRSEKKRMSQKYKCEQENEK